MPDLIRHKRSSTASAVPSAASLELGELAINTADARLFLKRGDGTVVDVTSIGGIHGLQAALDGKAGSDDARLTDAREWTATIVTQAEAKAGTATTRRAWTAQRVRQAIEARFTTLTSEWGRAFVLLADAAAGRTALSVREQLTAPRTYYVRTDGSDANTGLANTAGGAFLTMQKAIDVAAGLDVSVHNVTISVGAGTFAGFVCKDPVGAGLIYVAGAGAGTTVILHSAASGAAVDAGRSTRTIVQQLTISAPNGSARGVVSGLGSRIAFQGGIDFAACGGYHVDASGGQVTFWSYSVSGSALIHWYSANGGLILAAGITVTISGVPGFSSGWAYCEVLSLIRANANTFDGSATGRRFFVNANALVVVGGAGLTYLPGSTDGVEATGGRYL